VPVCIGEKRCYLTKEIQGMVILKICKGAQWSLLKRNAALQSLDQIMEAWWMKAGKTGRKRFWSSGWFLSKLHKKPDSENQSSNLWLYIEIRFTWNLRIGAASPLSSDYKH